jgi:hypothetical protein
LIFYCFVSIELSESFPIFIHDFSLDSENKSWYNLIMLTTTIKSRLVALAVAAHGLDITPASGRATLHDCISDEREYSGCWMLWYNTPDNSTHIAQIEG